MKYLDTTISALTAFVISAGGALATVAASNGEVALNKTAWTVSIVFGLISAAKDVRSSMRLPPVDAAASGK